MCRKSVRPFPKMSSLFRRNASFWSRLWSVHMERRRKQTKPIQTTRQHHCFSQGRFFSSPFIRFDRSFLGSYSSPSEDERFPSAGVSACHVTDAFPNVFCMIRLRVKLPPPGSAVHLDFYFYSFISLILPSFRLPEKQDENEGQKAQASSSDTLGGDAVL